MKKCYVKALFFTAVTLITTSCAVQHEAILGDAIRFSDDAYSSYSHSKGIFKNLKYQSVPYKLYYQGSVRNEDIQKMKDFIRADHQGKFTAGYYALDLGLDRVRYIRKNYFKHDQNTKFYIIYMTDGLDNTSVQVAKNNKQIFFTNRAEGYAKHIQRKIKRTMGVFKIRQNTFKIFPMMFLGNDIMSNMNKRGLTSIEDIKNAVKEDMKYYRGSSKGTSTPEVLLGTNFLEITQDFEEMFESSGFDFYVPVGYRGENIRMNLEDADGKEIQIEGTLKKKWFMWCLTNIKYPNNVTIPDQRLLYRGKPLKELYASNRNDMKATQANFRMDDIKLNGKNFKVSYTSQDHGKYYETNSEYDAYKRNNNDAYVLLIMDESGSLGDQTQAEKNAMQDILDIIMKTATK